MNDWNHLCYPPKENSNMSENKSSNEWQKLWDEYSKSLENWKQLFDSVQKACTDMQQRFIF